MDAAILEGLEGAVISGVHRLRYEFPVGVPTNDGDLELIFEDGRCLLLHSVGERLVLRSKPWQDSFEEPLSPVNQEFVRRSGKWTIRDVGAEEEYRGLEGATVRSFQAVEGRVDIRTDLGSIRVSAEGDETRVWREIGGAGEA